MTTPTQPPEYIIAIPVYPGVDLMDVAAPHEIFKWAATIWKERTLQLYLVAKDTNPVTTRDGLQLVPHKKYDDVPHADLLWVPGGDPDALVMQMGDADYVRFIRSRSEKAEYVASVCEGALIAANAGLFDGYEVTTHWAFVECLRCSYPEVKVHPGYPRYVHDRNRVSGGGISSGLDEALYLLKIIAGEDIAKQVQVTIQYFPKPPVSGQLPDSVPCPLAGKIPVPDPTVG